MIYFPNKSEKYTAALRLLYQKIILNKGYTENKRNTLKKIYLAEALFKNTELMPIELEAYLYELLTAVFIKKEIDYEIDLTKNYLCDKKLITALILEICKVNDFLKIWELNGNIVIKSKKSSKINTLVKKQCGTIFHEVIEDYYYVLLPFCATQKKSKGFETAHEQLQNPYSPINLYF